MARLHANGVDIAYETLGDPGAPPMLLMMGVGAQLTAWPESLYKALADSGFFVVRYDNRDAGLSTVLEGELTFHDLMNGVPAPYLIPDMAADAVGLMDGLGIRAAHLVGVSLGGMIAQQVAIGHPDRVLSLCSMMATTGDPGVGQPSDRAVEALLDPPGEGRDGLIERNMRWSRAIGSPGYPPSEEGLRRRVSAAVDRSHQPFGTVRHVAAVLHSADRTEGLRGVSVPTLVVHGEEDPLVNVSGGKATAEAVPGADLRLFPGMGHDLPEPLCPDFVEAITRNAAKAG
jgi:pimeloyl-ACP methyl ester carboxylesterase